jgi:hypothetical protein
VVVLKKGGTGTKKFFGSINKNTNPFLSPLDKNFAARISLTAILLPPTRVPPGIESVPKRAAQGIKF